MKKRILIIDDDPRNIFALAATLRAKQFDVASCTSASEALAKLKTDNAFDAVLIDMMMPEMDGYEAIPLIKEITPGRDLPIFAVTAQAMVGDREKCLASGADHYVAKPIDVDRLLSLLESI
ncbi:Signal transduction histidine-protein kinase BarA [Flavobacterium longum]|uniref:response regulator n=1 Tax=Flavobacterium longum TaxID=1299340 RepID=UPI0039EBF300